MGFPKISRSFLEVPKDSILGSIFGIPYLGKLPNVKLQQKGGQKRFWTDMNCSLNSLQGGYIGDSIGDYYTAYTRSLDNCSHDFGQADVTEL